MYEENSTHYVGGLDGVKERARAFLELRARKEHSKLSQADRGSKEENEIKKLEKAAMEMGRSSPQRPVKLAKAPSKAGDQPRMCSDLHTTNGHILKLIDINAASMGQRGDVKAHRRELQLVALQLLRHFGFYPLG